MEKALATKETKTKSERSKHDSRLHTEAHIYEFEYSQAPKAAATFVRSDGRGFDLSSIPVTGIDMGSKLPTAGRAPGGCPTCSDESGSQPEDPEETDRYQQEQSWKEVPSPRQHADKEHSFDTEDPSVETEEIRREHAVAGLIVEDSAWMLSEGQMTKTAFLQKLRAEICRTIEPVLASVGQTTEGCPYLNFWLQSYQHKDAGHIERTIRRYAPDSAWAKTSSQYISLVTERALQAAQIWAHTGKLLGIPHGLPITLPVEAPGEEGSTADDGSAPIQFRAREGITDPVSIRTQLGDGQPLASHVRSRMEAAFETSLSHVRAHTGSVASRLSNRLNARAFTIGNHVAFGNGAYEPGTIRGDALIAHELAHTIQQRGADDSVEDSGVGPTAYNDLETDADHAAVGIVSRLWNKGNSPQRGITARGFPALRSGLKIQRCAGSQTRTTTPGGTTAAQGCGPSSIARTYVPNTSGNPPSLSEREFGTTSKLAAFPAYAACQRDGGWHFYLTALDVRIKSAVQPRTFKTDITSATDAVVTSGTYRTIMRDLRPTRTASFRVSCAGNSWTDTTNTYSARNTYWSYQFVDDHEAFHRTDWDSKYRPNLINAEQQICAHEIPSSQAESAADAIQQERRTLDGFMANAYQQTCREYSPQQESRAYDHGAPQYQGLVDAIQARAQSAGWAQSTPPPTP